MIEALAHVVETAQEVAVNVEECRISSSVIEDLKSLLEKMTDEVHASELSQEIGKDADNNLENAGIEIADLQTIRLDPRSNYFRNGHSYETDDRGTIYKKDGEFLPNVEYISNGGKYRVDANGAVETIQEGYQSTYEERLKFTPVDTECERGKWAGNRGESKYIPTTDTEAGARVVERLSEYNLNGIEYQDAIPNFSECAEDSVEIDMTDDRLSNFAKAYQEFAKKWNVEMKNGRSNWTAREVQTYKIQNRLSIHECPDRKTCQLISQDIHDYFRHSGGVFECKKSGAQNVGGGFNV